MNEKVSMNAAFLSQASGYKRTLALRNTRQLEFPLRYGHFLQPVSHCVYTGIGKKPHAVIKLAL